MALNAKTTFIQKRALRAKYQIYRRKNWFLDSDMFLYVSVILHKHIGVS